MARNIIFENKKASLGSAKHPLSSAILDQNMVSVRKLLLLLKKVFILLTLSLFVHISTAHAQKADTKNKQLLEKIQQLEKRLAASEQRYSDLLGQISALESLAKAGISKPRNDTFTNTFPPANNAKSETATYNNQNNNNWQNGETDYNQNRIKSNRIPPLRGLDDTAPTSLRGKTSTRRRVGLEQDFSTDTGNATNSNLTTSVLPFSARSPKELYNKSYSRLLKRDYKTATNGFRNYLAKYPDSAQAGSAQYWLGETYFVQKAYKKAADAFLKGYQKYKNSPKAANSLLKLGITLGKLGQKRAGCATLRELNRKYPNLSPYIRSRAVSEKRKMGCS